MQQGFELSTTADTEVWGLSKITRTLFVERNLSFSNVIFFLNVGKCDFFYSKFVFVNNPRQNTKSPFKTTRARIKYWHLFVQTMDTLNWYLSFTLFTALQRSTTIYVISRSRHMYMSVCLYVQETAVSGWRFNMCKRENPLDCFKETSRHLPAVFVVTEPAIFKL